MYYNSPSQTRTFKIEDNGSFAEEDIKWIKSLSHVSSVTKQKKSIRVRTEFNDAVQEIVDSINQRYCNGLNPKLSPLFCITVPTPPKHKR